MTIADAEARVDRAICALFDAGDAGRIAALTNQIYELCEHAKHAESVLALTYTLTQILRTSDQYLLLATAVSKMILDAAFEQERDDAHPP